MPRRRSRQCGDAVCGGVLDHPLRRELLRKLDGGEELSPRQLTEVVASRSLGNVSYHARVLEEYGALGQSRSESAEGSTERFYVSRVSDNQKVAAILEKTEDEDGASLGRL